MGSMYLGIWLPELSKVIGVLGHNNHLCKETSTRDFSGAVLSLQTTAPIGGSSVSTLLLEQHAW